MRALLAVLAAASLVAACSEIPTDPTAASTDLTLAKQLYCPGPFTMVGAKKDTAIDNKACPTGFDIFPTKIGEGDDRNEDGWYCLATKQNGVVITIDNRFDVEKGGKTPTDPK